MTWYWIRRVLRLPYRYRPTVTVYFTDPEIRRALAARMAP